MQLQHTSKDSASLLQPAAHRIDAARLRAEFRRRHPDLPESHPAWVAFNAYAARVERQ